MEGEREGRNEGVREGEREGGREGGNKGEFLMASELTSPNHINTRSRYICDMI